MFNSAHDFLYRYRLGATKLGLLERTDTASGSKCSLVGLTTVFESCFCLDSGCCLGNRMCFGSDLFNIRAFLKIV